MRTLFFLFIISAISFAVFSQDKIAEAISDTTKVYREDLDKESIGAQDSSIIHERSFDQSSIEQLRSSDDFDYKQPPSVAESLWDRFLMWLDQLFGWILRGAVQTDWGRVFLYALGIAVMVIIVMMLLKVDALRVFYSGADKGPLNYQSFQENIHEMDFEKLIRESIEKKEYRLAVRLTFLYSLKLLSDKQHVDWRPGKTNHDYLQELKEGELKTGFNELSFYFDYTWYGEFVVNENLYQRVSLLFDNWKKKV